MQHVLLKWGEDFSWISARFLVHNTGRLGSVKRLTHRFLFPSSYVRTNHMWEGEGKFCARVSPENLLRGLGGHATNNATDRWHGARGQHTHARALGLTHTHTHINAPTRTHRRHAQQRKKSSCHAVWRTCVRTPYISVYLHEACACTALLRRALHVYRGRGATECTIGWRRSKVRSGNPFHW